MHLVGLAIRPGRSEHQLLAHCPKAQQTDAKFPLNPCGAFGFQATLDRIADMGGHILKVRDALLVATDSLSVVFDAQEVNAVLFPANECDVPGSGINAVLDEFGDCLERIALGKSNDADRIPVVADT